MDGRVVAALAVALVMIGCSAGGSENTTDGMMGTGGSTLSSGSGGLGAGSGGRAGGTGGSSALPGGGSGGHVAVGSGGMGMIGSGGMGTIGSGGMGMIGSGGMGMIGSGGMTGGGASGTGGPVVMGSGDPKIPEVTGDCPQFAEGTQNMDFMDFHGAIWEIGPKSNGTGTLVFYWHGTGSTSGEYASSTFQGAALQELKSMGGILVSPQSGSGTGGDCSGTGTFAMDDFNTADQIAACAVRDWGIDPHRIWATGCSAGGLQSGCMMMMRSSYMAGAVPNSGGEVFPIGAEDPSHVGSILTIHGEAGSDVVIVDFSDTSKTMDDAVKAAGGFAVDCNHHGGHCGLPLLPPEASAAGWEFIKSHPFGVNPEPYASGLPSSFPEYCKIW
jgi:hypothetical protein